MHIMHATGAHIMHNTSISVGVTNRRVLQKSRSIAFVVLFWTAPAYLNAFLAISDKNSSDLLIRLEFEIGRFLCGRQRQRRRQNRLLYPFAHAHGVINKFDSIKYTCAA